MSEETPEITEAETGEEGYPEWYLENYAALERFLATSIDGRSTLVGEASGTFGVLLSSLTPDGIQTLIGSGRGFYETTMGVRNDLSMLLDGLSPEETLFLMLGVAVEAIGIQQMKIQEAKTGASQQ